MVLKATGTISNAGTLSCVCDLARAAGVCCACLQGMVGMTGTHYTDSHVTTGFANALARPLLRARQRDDMSEGARADMGRPRGLGGGRTSAGGWAGCCMQVPFPLIDYKVGLL